MEQIAKLISEVCRFPAESNQEAYVREVLHRWSRRRAITTDVTEPTQLQIQLLKTFDLDFSRRRIRFMTQGINRHYDKADQPGRPTRASLDSAKVELYAVERRLRITASQVEEGLARSMRDLFKEERVDAGHFAGSHG